VTDLRLSPPPNVRVGPHTYSVLVSDIPLNKIGQEAKTVFSGHTDHRKLEITVAEDLAPSIERAVVLHELLHACFMVGANNELLSKETEEQVVSMLEAPLLDTLTANPELLRYLTNGE